MGTEGHADVVGFEDVGAGHVALVGGKGASLGELARIDGVHVPPGFCVTTDAFRRVVGEADSAAAVEAVTLPADLIAAIGARVRPGTAYAVRSSATAEDSPTASFAGQHDSYLGVVGAEAVVEHVRKVWASLFTERAVAYRRRHDLGAAPMAVVVQELVEARAAGILFTADPVTSNRKVATVEAVTGLGEALVSGRVSPDTYRVRDGAVVGREPQRAEPVLTDAELVRLVDLGRRVEAHFGRPQDIEWCLADDTFALVQSRPITTLFPVPAAADDGDHVYLSVGHQQMMTDPMKPLGISFFQLTAKPPMHEAGGRLFVDVTQQLASPTVRAGLLQMIATGDPLTGDALRTVIDRGFVATVPDAAPAGPPPGLTPPAPIATDPAIVEELVAHNEASVAALERDIQGRSGPALLDFILEDIQELRRLLFDPRSFQVFMGAMDSSQWLNDHMLEWLGEKNAADALTQSVPHNVTSEMGLALLDVADAVRPHPEVVAVLEQAEDDGFLDALAKVPGGAEARDAILAYLDRYGMRCIGEIDITRPRWSERPSLLVPMILGNVRTFAAGAGAERFERGRREAAEQEQDLLQRLRALPGGEAKAAEAKEHIDRVRTFIGYREYPKYGFIRRYFIYKRALLEEADRLVAAGVLREREDSFFLSFAELHEVTRSGRVDQASIDARKVAFRAHQALTPPRVLTSEGEALTGAYRRDDVPAGALVGLAVSSGTVEGRARVVLDVADADLGPDDILVTAFTDPSWSPLFVAIKGLVTEVGGLMTHGAVIAREYGLPAVVGVERATRLIPDGARIRVHGTDGYVELLA